MYHEKVFLYIFSYINKSIAGGQCRAMKRGSSSVRTSFSLSLNVVIMSIQKFCGPKLRPGDAFYPLVKIKAHKLGYLEDINSFLCVCECVDLIDVAFLQALLVSSHNKLPFVQIIAHFGLIWFLISPLLRKLGNPIIHEESVQSLNPHSYL